MVRQVEDKCALAFAAADKVNELCQRRVLQAFTDFNVSTGFMGFSNGYGYNDEGRDTLDCVFASALGYDDAIVRHSFASGTHAITTALFGIVRPNDKIFFATGQPYDTMRGVISGENGTLEEWGVVCEFADLPDVEGETAEQYAKRVISKLKLNGVKVVYIQRSRGYAARPSLTAPLIDEICDKIKNFNDDIITFVDNCYGEFVNEAEPQADVVAGSLIKNPGGRIAQTGGYVAGKREFVDLAAARLVTPSQGREAGCSLGELRNMFQGLLYAPQVVCDCVKSASFAAALFDKSPVSPKINDSRGCIVERIVLGDRQKLIKFCQTIQKFSPVDSAFKPEPAPMPGYDCDIIMASGSFVQGSSIEMSADAPLREPFAVYFQGCHSYVMARMALLAAWNGL